MPWWQDAVVYQIYPRSFADSNGDGVGDLEGIRRHLDHLTWLGVDAVWLSPFYRSPMKDFGYDVADYCDVDPLFGTLDDVDRLIAEAHERGLKVMVDWVPNHTSDQHPWFVESRRSRTNEKADWYVWLDGDGDGTPDRPPNNWRCAFTNGSAWEWVPEREQWYLHLFLPEQPDLNWRNPEVVEAMHGTLRFWLDSGIDGFRVDVVHGLLKDPAWADVDEDDPRRYSRPTMYDIDGTIELVRGFRRVLEEYDGDRAMVGEVYILSTAEVARFYGDGDALHMAFNFPPLYAPWDARSWRKRIDRVAEEFDPRGAWPTWVLSNHDNPRHRTRYGGGEDRARAAAVLLLTLRGTPFLYAGEELGMEDAIVPPDRVVDPGGRDGCRAPIPWTPSVEDGYGWGASVEPWLPWPPSPRTCNALVQRDDDASIANLYRRVLAARRASPALRVGAWSALPSPDGVLVYERVAADGGDRRVVIVNYTDDAVGVDVDVDVLGIGMTVEIASDGVGEGAAFDGSVGPSQALILR